jgi:hypothetical protein
MDYVLQLGLIAVFAFGAVYVSDARETLQGDGCRVYWETYNPGVNLSEVALVSKSEYEEIRRRSKGAVKPDFEKNTVKPNTTFNLRE